MGVLKSSWRYTQKDLGGLIRDVLKAKDQMEVEMVVGLIKKKPFWVQESLPYFIEALEHEYSWVRMRAAQALGELGDERAIEPLIDSLKKQNDSNFDFLHRVWAVYALRNFQGSDAFSAVLDALQDINEEVRYAAATVLGDKRNPKAIPYLERASKNDSSRVKKVAQESIIKIERYVELKYS